MKKNDYGHLKPETQKWIRAVVKDYCLEPHHERLLLMAGENWDRSRQARQILETSGLTVIDPTTGIPKPHPAVKIERDSQIVFARLMREIGLDNQSVESRLPRREGN